ncbi:MAG: hypothetical protein EOO65_03710 [Methanosarcinales archaeon]|nr:MAG: hypothetical protein EOO65_03710 [Methanosarcinales archaeon]
MTQSGVFAPIAPLLVNGGRMYYLTTFETSVESGVTRGTRVSGVADNLYLLAIDHHASILGRIHWTWQMQVPAPMSAGTSATPPLAALSLPAPNTLLLATVQNQTWGRNSGSTASVCGIADYTADLAAVPTLLWQVRMNVTCGSANSSNAVACLRPWMIADVASAMSPPPVWVMLDAAQPTFLYMNASTGSTLARVQVSQAVAGASPMACPLASNLSAPGARLTARAMPLASLASASGTGANDTTPGLLIVAQYAFSSSMPSARSQLWLIALRTQTSGAANVAWCSYVSDLLAPAYGGVDTSSHMAAMLIPAQSSGLAAMKSSGTPSMSTLLLVPTATEIVAFG